MKKLILFISVILFVISFSGCLQENEIGTMMGNMDDGDIVVCDYIWDAPDRYCLTMNQLQDLFRGTLSFREDKIRLLAKELESFLLNNPCYRRIMYEIYQTVGGKRESKAFIKLDEKDSKLQADPRLWARYDQGTKTIIFRDLQVGVIGGIQGTELATLIHELMHHWQYLLFGESYMQAQYEKNFEFEVTFLLDVAMIQYAHRYADLGAEQVLLYLKYDLNNPVIYTQEEKERYINAINNTLQGNTVSIKAELDFLAANFRKYDYAVYTPWAEYSLIKRLYP